MKPLLFAVLALTVLAAGCGGDDGGSKGKLDVKGNVDHFAGPTPLIVRFTASSKNGKGKVLLLRYAEGHDSTTQREEGFLEALANHKGIEVVSSNQYLGADVEGAVKRGEAILSNYRTPDGGLSIDAIFCVNESTTFALMRVLQDHNWAGKVKFVGFDASDNLIKGLADGHIDALIIQDPVKMGYLAVKTLVAHIKGEKVEKRIDTGVHIATKENMEEPAMKELLKPDLSKWLK